MEGLKLLTGRQSETIELKDRRLRPLALPDQSAEDWILLAVENRPELRQVKAGLSARRALVEATRADSKPIVFAGVAGSVSVAPGRDRLDNPHIYDLYNHTALSPVVGMRWEWEAGAQPARVAQAQAELDALIQKASFARQGIPFQVREQYYLVQSKFESIQAMKSSAQAGRRWMIAAYADFEAGLEEADRILTAMQVYVVAYAEYLKNVNDFNNSVYKLKSVSGVYE
jgi:outer membrane protein TolC